MSKAEATEKFSKFFFPAPVVTTIKHDTCPPTTTTKKRKEKNEGLGYKL